MADRGTVVPAPDSAGLPEPLSGRIRGLDVLRGLAVVLMVVDHALVAGGAYRSPVRLTLTRAALPLFCLVAGSLLPAHPRWGRLGLILLAAVPATVLGLPIGLGQPDVLVILAVVLAVAPVLWRRWPVSAAVVAILQPVTWRLPWTGYQPGTVLALVLLGACIGREKLAGAAPGGWASRPLAWVGARALSFYVVHVAVLAVAVATF